MFFADDLVLFAKSDPKQMSVIQKCLDTFCAAFGAKVSTQKTKIFFSRNTHNDARRAICDGSGFMEVPSLGKYLGVSIFMGRITKAAYSYVIDNICKKLIGWKMKSLSFASCITLINSVLTSIPNYVMQSVPLPIGLCDEIDVIVRSFLWGNYMDQGKVNLVDWKIVCDKNDRGGLGIKQASLLNKGYMMKIAWHLLLEPNALWARVLRYKYVGASLTDFN